MNKTEVAILGCLTLVVCVALSFGLAWVVMLLWNWLMPMLFGLTTITFWQAFGLNILVEILFRSTDYVSIYDKYKKKNE